VLAKRYDGRGEACTKVYFEALESFETFIEDVNDVK
jgi:hypothetical protein